MIKIVLISAGLLVALLGLCVCSPADVLNATITRKGYSVYYNIPYGFNSRNKLDIYVPDKLASPHTTLVYFHGGSWQSGDKNIYRFLGQAFASKGFITVVINYRLYPEVYFPAFINDGAEAVRWVHMNIQKYGGNPRHVFLVGHSAGAQIAALLATDEHYLKAQNGDSTWLQGVIGIAGPYDFLPFTDPKIKALFSKSSDFSTQPINYVKSGLPPFLVVSGDKDDQVYPKNTINFAYRLQQFKVPVTQIIYPGIGHIGIILSLTSSFRYKAPLLEDISRFIDSVNHHTRFAR